MNTGNMASLVCDVPQDLLRTSIMPFLNLRDIILLDSAANNHSFRREWVESLHGQVITTIRPVLYSTRYIIWSKRKNCTTDNFIINIGDEYTFLLIKSDKKIVSSAHTLIFVDCGIDGYLPNLLNHCPKLKVLEFRNCRSVFRVLQIVPESILNNLTRLCLENCLAVDGHCILRISEYCPQLQHLELSQTASLHFDESVAGSLGNMKNLTFLGLGYHDDLNDEDLITISERCKKLKGLDLTGCIDITDDGVIFLALQLPGLEVLKCAYCSEITDASVQVISNHCKSLLHIDLKNCETVTDASIELLQTCCPLLQTLSVSELMALTDKSLGSIAKFTQLQSLDLSSNSNFSDRGMVELLQGPCSKALLNLNLAWCTKLTDVSVAAVAQDCPQLKCLNLDSSIQAVETPNGIETGGRTGVTANGVVFLAYHRIHLVDLNIANVAHVSDGTVLIIARYCTHMEKLNLYGCNWITNTAVGHIALHLHKLRVLNISCCRKITSLSSIEKQCTKLEKLNLKGCRNISNIDVQNLVLSCVHLRELNLQECCYITSATVRMCTRLRSLTIAWCTQVTSRAVKVLTARAEELVYLDICGCININHLFIHDLMVHRPHITIRITARQRDLSQGNPVFLPLTDGQSSDEEDDDAYFQDQVFHYSDESESSEDDSVVGMDETDLGI